MANPLPRSIRLSLLAMPILRTSLQRCFAYLNLSKSTKLPRITTKCSFSCVAFRKGKTSSILNGSIRSASQKSEKKFTESIPMSWPVLAICLVAGGGLIWFVRGVKEDSEKAKEKERTRSIGLASLGGPFELTDHNGNPKTEKDFLGKWLLIYFGFTHCPDICPDQLEKMAEVLDSVDKSSGMTKIQPLYISVDPDRDDAETIKEYLKDFHPRMLGLTGTEEQLKKVTKAYRVYYSSGPKDEDEDYIVDHTIIWYFVNPEGKFVEYFGQNRSIEEISATVVNRMIAHKLK